MLVDDIKNLIIESLDLEDIEPNDIDENEPLFVDGLGLDSIDALELGMALKKKYNLSDIQTRVALDITIGQNSSNIEENKEKKKQRGSTKSRKKLVGKGKEIIVETNIVTFFSLNDEENTKYNNYLNALGQDGDNFDYIKNNPLISNYKYPTNYLTLYYFF